MSIAHSAVRVALADDDAAIRELFAEYIERYNTEYGVQLTLHTYTSGVQLLSQLNNATFDVIFLDIDMPGTNGMNTARELRSSHNRTIADVAIIFVTNLTQYALQGYEVQAMDYIVKPLSYFDFALKITRIIKAVRGKASAVIALETTDGLRSVDVHDITYLEARDHYVFAHTVHDYTYKMRESITNISQRLERYGFLRVHKSFTVNMCHIEALLSSVVMCYGDEIPVGRSYKKNVQPAYLAFMGGQ